MSAPSQVVPLGEAPSQAEAAEAKDLWDEIAQLHQRWQIRTNWNDDPAPLRAAAAKVWGSNASLPEPLKRRRLYKAMSTVTSVAWASDSLHLVSTSQEGKIIVWDAFTGQKINFISLPDSWLMCGAYSPSDDSVVVGGLDNTVSIFKLKGVGASVDSPSRRDKAAEFTGHAAYISSITYLSENRIVSSSGGQDANLMVWDATRGGDTPVTDLQGHQWDVSQVVAMPNSGGNVLVSGSLDHTCRVWDVRRPQSTVMQLPGHAEGVNAIAAFPDGNAFVSGSNDCTARLYDIRAGRQLNVYAAEGERNNISTLDISNSGRLLFTGSPNGHCDTWDVPTGALLARTSTHVDHISCVRVSPDGQALCQASRDTTLSIWV